jgi:hypothetical protein
LHDAVRIFAVGWDRQDIFMRGFFDGWCEVVRFACEAQGVIAMRLALIAAGGPQAAAEAHQMVAEKLGAFGEGQMAAMHALALGEGPWVAAERAYGPIRRDVHDNSCRLSAAPH